MNLKRMYGPLALTLSLVLLLGGYIYWSSVNSAAPIVESGSSLWASIVQNKEWLFSGVGIVILTSLAGSITWLWRAYRGDKHQAESRVQGRLEQHRRINREVMLNRMRYRVQEVREQSLHKAIFIELDFQKEPNAVRVPQNIVLENSQNAGQPSPQDTTIVEAFDQAGGSLLILGEPGSGKTTLLYELANVLVERADQDIEKPIPIVLNLSSWAEKRPPIEEWLVSELQAYYGITSRVAQDWVDNDLLLLLLDGLDEVHGYQVDCVQALNQYQGNRLYAVLPMVVCCRNTEYKALPIKLALQKAVSVQLLTDAQIRHYFWDLNEADPGGDALRIHRMIENEPELKELKEEVRYPLMLNIIILAYQGNVANITSLIGRTSPNIRSHIFDAYIQRMFERRSREHPYAPKDTKHWLSWLARKMQQHDQTIFLLERIQLTWLDCKSDRRLYQLQPRLLVGLISGLTVWLGGLIIWLSLGLSGKQIDKLPVNLLVGLLVGLSLGLLFGPSNANIKPIEQLNWSFKWLLSRTFWRDGLLKGLLFGPLVGLSLGLLFGLLDGLLVGPLDGLLVGLLVGPLVGLVVGLLNLLSMFREELTSENIQVPNQGIWQTAKYAITFGLLGGLITWLLFGLLFGPLFGLVVGPLFGLLVGLPFGLVVGLPFFEHYLLRYGLFRRKYTPWNYVRFLEYATERIFLRRVGGGYKFTHRLLQEHFAEMTEQE